MGITRHYGLAHALGYVWHVAKDKAQGTETTCYGFGYHRGSVWKTLGRALARLGLLTPRLAMWLHYRIVHQDLKL